MNTKLTPLTRAAFVAMLVGAAPALVAAPPSKQSNPERKNAQAQNSGQARDQDRMSVRQAPEDPRGRSASELLGMDVYGDGGEKLGDLHDLVVDANTGKVAYAVVASGGILGFGSNLRAVPIESLTTNPDSLSVDVNKTRWKQAPVFTEEQLLSLNRLGRGAQLHEFFGGKPPEQSPQDPAASSQDRESPRQFVLVSDIRGKEVRGNGREIGEVDEVIVQMQSHTAAALLDTEDDFVGNEENYLVPLSKLHGFHTDTLTSNLRPEDFTNATYSTDASWATPVGYVSTLWVWPAYAPGFAAYEQPLADGVAMNNDRQGPERTPRAGTNSGNRPPLDAVRQAVRAETPGGGDNIDVVAEQDKLVLRGTVPSEDLKERIEDRAEQAAQGWDIDSELRVAQSD